MKIIIAILIIAFGVIYWRGTKAELEKNGYKCDWHALYAVCKEPTKTPPSPSFIEILQAGIKLK